MIVNQLDYEKAKSVFEQMLSTGDFKRKYSDDNSDINLLVNEMDHLFKNDAKGKTPYQQDLIYGKRLYELLSSFEWFDWTVATNKDFWSYIALYSMPQIIFDRFKKEDKDGGLKVGALGTHFYSKWTRVYPCTLYWIFKICDKGAAQETYDFLSAPCFSTDTILNVVERMGPKGFRIDVYGKIIDRFANLEHQKYAKSIGAPNYILRAILVSHGIKNSVYIPELAENGIDGYIDMVFKSALGEDYV